MRPQSISRSPRQVIECTTVTKLKQIREVYLAYEYIDILYRRSIYTEILHLIIVFIIFRGVFAPPNQYVALDVRTNTGTSREKVMN